MGPLFSNSVLSGRKTRWFNITHPGSSAKRLHTPRAAFIFMATLVLVAGCGHGRTGKIKLHPRDSADAAVAGKWIFVNQTEKDSIPVPASTEKAVTAFVLYEDHSALVYIKTLKAKTASSVKGKWTWISETENNTSGSAANPNKGILIRHTDGADSSFIIKLAKTTGKAGDVLVVPNGETFKKEIAE